MFKNTFQAGFLSLFSSIGSHPLQLWGVNVSTGVFHLVEDNELSSNVYELMDDIDNLSQSYIYCPSNMLLSLSIKLPVLLLTVKNLKKCFTFEITCRDDKNKIRRFRASNFQSTTRIKPYICTLPLILEDGWNHIQVNLPDLCRRIYDSSFNEVISIVIHPNCRIKRVCFSEKVCKEDEWPNEFKLFIPTNVPVKNID